MMVSDEIREARSKLSLCQNFDRYYAILIERSLLIILEHIGHGARTRFVDEDPMSSRRLSIDIRIFYSCATIRAIITLRCTEVGATWPEFWPRTSTATVV